MPHLDVRCCLSEEEPNLCTFGIERDSWYYVALRPQTLPHRVDLCLAKFLPGLREGARDPWPTAYAANTTKAIRGSSRPTGLALVHFETVEKKFSHGRVHAVLFVRMLVRKCTATMSRLLQVFRANTFKLARKANPSSQAVVYQAACATRSGLRC